MKEMWVPILAFYFWKYTSLFDCFREFYLCDKQLSKNATLPNGMMAQMVFG
jgi:hypothetical protein